MKNYVRLLLLAVIPLAALENADLAPMTQEAAAMITDADALIDPMPSQPLSTSKGRGLGDILLTINALALGIDGPSGLSWDGQYLYVASLLNDSVYVVEPFGPSVVNKWATDIFASSPYGCGIEQNVWVTHINPDTAREYTTAGVATGNAFSTEPSGATYCGDGSEWWPNGEIWFVGIGSGCGNQCIKFSVPSGTILGTMGNAAWTYTSQRGMTYDPYNEKFWVGGWNSDSVWELNLDGSPTGRTFFMDGCAGIAYDWQSTYHPTPVLWITRQGADQIVMVDADNPNPSPGPVLWDFEDGWQGWTHTNGFPFPRGWDVEPSNYKPAWTPPDAGDSTMWIDSDAVGSGILVEDTAWSPPVVPPTNMAWLKYGLGYNNLSATSDSLYVGVMTFTSGVWNPPVQLKRYSADYGPALDSLDVTTYNTADSIRIYFYYSGMYDWWAGFDNVRLYAPSEHDVGCNAVVSPPAGSVTAGDYDVIGRIQNYGWSMETFDVTANVYDTVGMVSVFSQTVTLTDFPVGGDSNVNFGTVTFEADKYYYTEVFTELAGDADPSNDTASVYSTTALALGDVVYELDVETITGNSRLLGVEFDGANFYVTGGTGTGSNSIWVIDTFGAIVCQVTQPTSSAWGMRDLAWDGVYAGPDRIDTLYAGDESGLYKFGIDLTGSYTSYGTLTGPVSPCRAMAWDGDDEWFFTADWTPYYKFSKTNPLIQTQASGPGSTYGAAYDTDPVDGGWLWWHSQVGASACQIDQMEPTAMTWTGVTFAIYPTITTGIAGGLCFHEGFRGMDVLFALVQGPPDAIIGVFVRTHGTGMQEEPSNIELLTFGFAPNMTNPMREQTAISYVTSTQGHVILKVYDGAGRLVETLVNSVMPAGTKTVNWDVKDISNGIYFLRLEAENNTATHKLILVK